MNISKIIENAMIASVEDIKNGKFQNNINFEDSEINELIKQNQLLMNYSAHLLESYHEELSKLLTEQGINV